MKPYRAIVWWRSVIETRGTRDLGGCVAGASPVVEDLVELVVVLRQGAHVSTGVSFQKLL